MLLMVCVSGKNMLRPVQMLGQGGGCRQRVAVATLGGGLASQVQSRRPVDSHHREQGAECLPRWVGALPKPPPHWQPRSVGLGSETPHCGSPTWPAEAQRTEAG